MVMTQKPVIIKMKLPEPVEDMRYIVAQQNCRTVLLKKPTTGLVNIN